MENEMNTYFSETLGAEDIKRKYGKVYQVSITIEPDDVTTLTMEYCFTKPTTPSYERYIKTASSGMTKALSAFMFDNVVPEHKKKLEADLEEYPALAMSIGEKLLAMLGLSKETNLMKL